MIRADAFSGWLHGREPKRQLVIGFSVFTYSCSYVQVAWIQRLMAITYWPMQKVRILSGFSHRCHKRQKARYNG